MSTRYYNRYQNFLINGKQTVVPYVNMPSKTTDQRYIYRQAVTRLDKVSQEYYGTPYFGWLILQANPQFGGFNLFDRFWRRFSQVKFVDLHARRVLCFFHLYLMPPAGQQAVVD